MRKQKIRIKVSDIATPEGKCKIAMSGLIDKKQYMELSELIVSWKKEEVVTSLTKNTKY